MRIIILGFLFSFILLSCNEKTTIFDKEKSIHELNILLDSWHHAAAIGDEDLFFTCLDSNSVYLGTDPNERWLKHEFKEWALPYFQRDTAWAFKPYNRIWEFSNNGEIAWFDELLETHMGICRGSGVLVHYKDGWKIKHYNLALTLPNDKMKDFRLIQGI